MGWKPSGQKGVATDYTLLSENQCGMETLKGGKKMWKLPVEREPMWDGNVALLPFLAAKFLC